MDMKKIIFTFFLIPTLLFAQTFSVTPFATGLDEVVDIAMAPGDDRLYVVERAGIIRIVNTDGSLDPTPFMNITSRVWDSNNEQGLLGLAFDPNYQTNGYFYVNYIIDSTGSAVDEDTRISRFTRSSVDPDAGDPTSEVKLLRIVQPYWNHNGGCLRFGKDGYLYCSLGDGGSGGDPGNRAQNPTNILGKILRINVKDVPSYSIPVQNPFYDSNPSDTLPIIWALGVRNPWKFDVDNLRGDIWMGDVGQNVQEEVNYEAYGDGGKHYGWRCYEGTAVYNTSVGCTGTYVTPVATYNHSGGLCSVTGGIVYRGGKWGNLYEKFIYTDFCVDRFYTSKMNYTTSTVTNVSHNTIAGFDHYFSVMEQDNKGNIYIADLYTGTVYTLNIDICTPTATVNSANALTTICDGGSLALTTPAVSGFSYQWLLNGSPISGATSDNYSATAVGNYQVIVTNPTCGTNGTDTSAVLTLTSGASTPVTILHDNDTLCQGDGNFTLGATPTGGNYISPFVDAAGNFYVNEVDTGNTYTVTYEYINAAGCRTTANATIFIDYCFASVENEFWGEIKLFPNPADEVVNIELTNLEHLNVEDITIQLLGMDGKVLSQTNTNVSASKLIQLPINSVAAGMYVVKLSDGKTSVMKKLIIE